jgi:lipoprotein-releasing system ATP-binding protein
MPDPVLRLEQVTKAYTGAVVTRVLHGIDLVIGSGDFAALVGPSGSGKSTLLNIVGLLDRPSSGRVWVDGLDTAQMNERTLTRFRGLKLGFVFQFHHLLPAFTALENVMLPDYSLRGRPSSAMRARASELLERMGLSSRTHHPASRLSGGEQQRVAIARSLMLNPSLLLADEPTGNLDTHSADQILDLLAQLRRESGMALLVVTHDMRLAQRADRVVELVDGRVVKDTRSAAVSTAGAG